MVFLCYDGHPFMDRHLTCVMSFNPSKPPPSRDTIILNLTVQKLGVSKKTCNLPKVINY